MSTPATPAHQSRWRHCTQGGAYTVVATARGSGALHGDTVIVYTSDSGTLYARCLSEWHRRMVALPA